MTELYVRPDGANSLGVRPASPGDIVAAFNALPLPTRMRTLVGLGSEVAREYESRTGGSWPGLAFTPEQLARFAGRWEAEDAEKADQETKVEELAQVMRGDYPGWEIVSADLKDEYRARARAALEWMQGQQK